jgi:hypothetical protein
VIIPDRTVVGARHWLGSLDREGAFIACDR